MSLHDLLNKTINAEVQRSGGIGEYIDYSSRDLPIISWLKVIVQKDIGKDKIDDTDKDFILFHAVKLPFTPSTGDVITYNGIKWDFHRVQDNYGDLYDILSSRTRHIVGRQR